MESIGAINNTACNETEENISLYLNVIVIFLFLLFSFRQRDRLLNYLSIAVFQRYMNFNLCRPPRCAYVFLDKKLSYPYRIEFQL